MATINQVEMVSVLLAHSAEWQALVGAADVSEALAFIHGYQAEDAGEEAHPYPRAIVQEVEKEKTLVGTATYRGRGALFLQIEVLVPDEHAGSVQQQDRWFRGVIDQIEADMRATSASRAAPAGYSHSHFQFRRLTWHVEPFLEALVEREDEDPDSDVPRRPKWCMAFRFEY